MPDQLTHLQSLVLSKRGRGNGFATSFSFFTSRRFGRALSRRSEPAGLKTARGTQSSLSRPITSQNRFPARSDFSRQDPPPNDLGFQIRLESERAQSSSISAFPMVLRSFLILVPFWHETRLLPVSELLGRLLLLLAVAGCVDCCNLQHLQPEQPWLGARKGRFFS